MLINFLLLRSLRNSITSSYLLSTRLFTVRIKNLLNPVVKILYHLILYALAVELLIAIFTTILVVVASYGVRFATWSLVRLKLISNLFLFCVLTVVIHWLKRKNASTLTSINALTRIVLSTLTPLKTFLLKSLLSTKRTNISSSSTTSTVSLLRTTLK